MATRLDNGAGMSFNAGLVTQSLSSSKTADLVFDGVMLKLPAFGVGWPAISGPHGKGSLPLGRYTCKNLRPRTEVSMIREGVGFSVDLIPQFSTTRTNLRIHPDGNVPGTLGCIGITRDVKECYETLKRLLPSKDSVCELEVQAGMC